jgi:drug/metabolite transporter (DMT)-like permease
MRTLGIILIAAGLLLLVYDGLGSLDNVNSLADLAAVSSGAFFLMLGRERARGRF